MNEEQLNKFFQEVREIPPETSPADISSWVSSAAQSVGSGLSTKPFFTFKGIAMITTIASVIGIAVFSHFAPATVNEQNQPVSPPVLNDLNLLTTHEVAASQSALNETTNSTTTINGQSQFVSQSVLNDLNLLPKIEIEAPQFTVSETANRTTPLPAETEPVLLQTNGQIPNELIPLPFTLTTLDGKSIQSDVQSIHKTENIPPSGGNQSVPDTRVKVWEDFTRLKISSAMNVWIIQGDQCDVRVETEDGIDKGVVQIEQNGETLELSVRWKKYKLGDNLKWGINVYVTVRELEKLEVSGAVHVQSQNRLNCNRLDIELSGAVETELDINANDVKVETSGAVELKMKGNCKNLDAETSGAAEFLAPELSAESCVIETSGAASIDVMALKALKVESSGASRVLYRGNPENLDINTSGASEVKKVVQGYKF